MNLTRPSEVKALLAERGLTPRRSSGQNFLIDQNILRILVNAAELRPDDVVLEIGPGLGTLTEALMRIGCRVIAVEKDRGLFDHLRSALGTAPNLTLIHGDFLDLDFESERFPRFDAVVANLPYSVGSRILAALFQSARGPSRIVATVQLEVAQRLTAGPGDPEFGLLGLWAHLKYQVSLVRKISPTCFFPVPKVWSGIVRLDRATCTLARAEEEMFYRLTKHAFGYRRKQMETILSRAPAALVGEGMEAGAVLDAAGIPRRARPEVLGIPDWSRLVRCLPPLRHIPQAR